MDLGPRLGLGPRTQLVLTPQMRQALQILQAPQTELAALLRHLLSENVCLEEETAGGRQGGIPRTGASSPPAGAGQPSWLRRAGRRATCRPPAGGRRSIDWRERMARIPAPVEDGRAALLRQLRLQGASAAEVAIAEYLLGCLDARGYLALPVELLAADLARPVGEVEAVRQRLLALEPPGVAARGLAECLLAQLQASGEAQGLAARLLAEDLRLLAARRYGRLATRLGTTSRAVAAAAERIRRLAPRPLSGLGGPGAPPILPDLRIDEIAGGYEVSLEEYFIPRLRLAAPPAGVRRQSQAGAFLRVQRSQARWLLGSLAARRRTLMRLARLITLEQQGFLRHGVTALRPLSYREGAARLGLHESTVARAVRGKYVQTPRGIYALRFFFDRGLGGGGASAPTRAAVAARIRALVSGEPPEAPFSDAELARRLRREGVQMARRTVAKYRDRMDIPRAAFRKRADVPRPLPGRRAAG